MSKKTMESADIRWMRGTLLFESEMLNRPARAARDVARMTVLLVLAGVVLAGLTALMT